MSRAYRIAVLPGDGIGPEITAAALAVLQRAAEISGISLSVQSYPFGGCSIDAYGVPVTEEAMVALKEADAILLGAVGGPRWDTVAPGNRPEQALLRVRKELSLFANLRPTLLYPMLAGASPLRGERLENGIDLLIVRELTGGIYFGEHLREEAIATDRMTYSVPEIERIARLAFSAAALRRGKVCSVDKANVLACSRLWRDTVEKIRREEYPQIALEHLYVDNCAMQLVNCPGRFDVILTENMFGDILSDEASVLTGSIGMMPSASLSENGLGMYEPIHGSAPDIAGKDIANPIGTVLSAAMLCRYSLGEEKTARKIENAVETVLQKGARTPDIFAGLPGERLVGCGEMGVLIGDALE